MVLGIVLAGYCYVAASGSAEQLTLRIGLVDVALLRTSLEFVNKMKLSKRSNCLKVSTSRCRCAVQLVKMITGVAESSSRRREDGMRCRRIVECGLDCPIESIIWHVRS